MNLDLNTPFYSNAASGYFLRRCAVSGRAFVEINDVATGETLPIHLSEFGALCADGAAIGELEHLIGELLAGRGVDVDLTEH